MYTDYIEFAKEVFRIDYPEKTYCGNMSMTIENEYTFIIFDEEIDTVYLRPTFDDLNGNY